MNHQMQAHLPQIDLDKMQAVLDIETRFVTGQITLEEGRKEVAERVGKIRPFHLAFIEQTLIEHTDEECIRENMAQKIQLFEGYMDYSRPDVPEDHPLSRYYQENEEMKRLLLAVEDLVQYPVIKNQWLELFDQLRKYPIHYSRKQNQLYPLLEQKGFDRPTTTMWTFDDMVRDNIRDAYNLLEAGSEEEFIKSCNKLIFYGRDLMEKEETILYPTSYAMITAEEFEDMKEGDLEIGYAFFTPAEKRVKGTTVAGKSTETSASSAPEAAGFAADLQQLLSKYGYSAGGSEKLDVTTGKLSLEQINLIYQHLPFDISFVDENELVCFYSDTDHRIFPRSKNVIGRQVMNCHPRKSAHVVREVIDKLRSGEQDKAEFWINKPGFFIYIIYVAVRDAEGNFRGVIEVMQDCTHIRALEGSQTLLKWATDEGIPTEAPTEAPTETPSDASSHQPTTDADDAADSASNNEGLQYDSEGQVVITPTTRLMDLLTRFPDLRNRLTEISSLFAMLRTPFGKMMAKKADVQKMSDRSGVPLDKLIAGLQRITRELLAQGK
jgi:hemerythrin HHE cation binding domain-containing protein